MTNIITKKQIIYIEPDRHFYHRLYQALDITETDLMRALDPYKNESGEYPNKIIINFDISFCGIPIIMKKIKENK